MDVVAALIRSKDRFLACQRPAHKARGMMWEFPGGKIEAGESGPQALAREIREELGILVTVNDLFAEVTHCYEDVTVHLMLYETGILSGEPQKLEHRDIQWFSIAEAEEDIFCPADRIFLRKLKETIHQED